MATQENGDIKFTGLAYGGGVIDQWIGNEISSCVVDLSSTQFKDEVPIFWNHNDYGMPIGRTSLEKIENKIYASGVIYRHKDLPESGIITALMEKKHPFELSIGGYSQIAERVGKDGVFVNGAQQYPEFVMQQVTIGELSIVNFGADSTTFAKIAAKKQEQKEVLNMELEQKLEALQAKHDEVLSEKEALKSENATLKAQAAEASVKAQFIEAGVQLADDEVKYFAAMSQEQLKIVLKHAKPAEQPSKKIDASMLQKNVSLSKQIAEGGQVDSFLGFSFAANSSNIA